ncbi:DUF1145 domain-containing protein [Vibrio sp. FNV 38]|nr:DUF1145 domain-containing protein [Vibrio sp. FNV 38]
MKWFIVIAKLLFLAVWGILLSNFFYPYPEKLAMMLYALLGFIVLMHGMQAAIFITALIKRVPLSTADKLSIFVFGVFGLLGIKYKYADQLSSHSS